MRTIRPVVLACAFACALTSAGAGAASLQISPVSIAFKAGQGAAAISLQNQGDTPVYGQVRAYAWSQRDGEDVLVETTDVVVSPPIIEVAPRATQMIRLILKSNAPSNVERSYRLLVDEIPRGGSEASGVDIRLRYSVPVFVAPSGDAAPVLAWTLYRQGNTANGAWMMRVSNTGRIHAQLGATALRNAAGTDFELSKGLFGYVLPGQQRVWKLPLAQDAKLQGQVTVQSTVNARPETADAATP
ncbi:fimbrial chaperone protein [Pseudoduganella lurida]|uniref:Fimbrial chaperone protein n=1 Tax=Pseudoduganella lurida TaxID=1036180 RepID=A0A562RE15_9BURK|nr:molecular chaperone [Pseudoduganella lurida]TWI67301.1 fimbrial chaperone protein [Pseudoduganella lurida]